MDVEGQVILNESVNSNIPQFTQTHSEDFKCLQNQEGNLQKRLHDSEKKHRKQHFQELFY